VQLAIGEILDSLDDKVAIHEEIGRATAALRDALFPELLATPPAELR
jgi:hypothetical protein